MSVSVGGTSTAPASEATAPTRRPPLRRALVLVGIAAFLPFLAVVSWPDGNLTRHENLGGFYDAQAHALLAGHWNVDPSVVSIEGFTTSKGMMIYFGPVPAIARMPIAAVTHRFDGRLTRPSMLLAEGLLIVALIRLGDWLELLLHPRGPTRSSLFWRGLAVFGVATSIPLVLASWALVYNEAILWGATLATCAFWLITAHLVTRRIRPLVGATALAVLAVMTRASVGLGPFVAILGLGGNLAWVTWRARTTPASSDSADEELDRAPAAAAIAADKRRAATVLALGFGGLALAAGLYMGVNQARFGTPLRVPFERQLDAAGLASRRAALAANDGDLTNLAYLPTQALQLVNPTAIRFHQAFPFVVLPQGDAPLVVPATFENRRASNSLFTSAPIPFLLGVWGLLAVVAPHRRFRHLARRREASLLALGASAGLAGVLTFADIAPRYLGDALPVLAVTAFLGASVVAGQRQRVSDDATTGEAASPRHARPRRGRLLMSVAAVVTVLAVWVNGSFAMALRFDQSAGPPFTEERQWVSLQLRVARLFPGQYPPSWVGRELSSGAPVGSVAILGDCDALYRSNGSWWSVLEANPTTREGILLAGAPTSAPETVLVTLQDDRSRLQLALQSSGDGKAELVLRIPGRDEERTVPVKELRWDRSHRPKIHFLADSRTGQISIMSGGDVLLGIMARVPDAPLTPGPGIELQPAPHRICPDLERALTRAGR